MNETISNTPHVKPHSDIFTRLGARFPRPVTFSNREALESMVDQGIEEEEPLITIDVEDGNIPMREIGMSPEQDSGSVGCLFLVDAGYRTFPQEPEPNEPYPMLEWTASELMEEYMREAEMGVTDLIALKPKRVEVLEDDFVSQLVTPTCPITYAVTLLRLLEDDVRSLERLQTVHVEDSLDKHPKGVYKYALDALVKSQHHKLVDVITELKRTFQLSRLMESLDRMRYEYYYDKKLGAFHLRCDKHRMYGWIVI